MASTFKHRVRLRGSARTRFVGLCSRLQPKQLTLLDAVIEACGGWDAYFIAPASRQGHHASPGGLINHTVEVAEISCAIADALDESLVDHELLVLFALLHDVGKLREYCDFGQRRVMSDTGRWVGHKWMAVFGLGKAAEALSALGRRQALALLNALTGAEAAGASQGRGYATLEASIVNKADQISAASDLYRLSLRLTGQSNFYGTRHAHMREQPLHPVVLT